MLFDALAPSSALQLIGFADVDAFRPIESMEDARSIPLDVRNFAAARAVVSLPGCRIVMMRSFARILDGAYRMPGGMVILPMTDDLQVNSKGMDLDARFFIALRGSDECHFVERRTNHHAMIIFSPGLSDRGWFDQADDLRTYGANRPALLHARQLLLDILRTASVQPALFETTEVAAHLQEGLLLALDDLFRIDSLSGGVPPSRASGRSSSCSGSTIMSQHIRLPRSIPPSSPASLASRSGRLAAPSARCVA